MAHYAFLNSENIVTEVIVGINETELIEGLDTETWYGNYKGQVCKRTSYNNNYRFNYAGLGYYFDELKDGFIPPKCHDEAVVNNKCLWDCENAEHDTLFK